MLIIVRTAHLTLLHAQHASPISSSIVVPVPIPVQHALPQPSMLMVRIHAKIVILLMLTAKLVLVLQLHAIPAKLATTCPAQHALHVILDALLALELELENAQLVPQIIT